MSDETFVPAVFYQNPRAALAWLERAFGFEVTLLVESAEGDSDSIHAQMAVAGRGRVMIGGEWSRWAKSPTSVGGTNTQSVHVYIDGDVDAHCAQARQADAVILAEPENQFYGARTYRAADLEGHVWTFAQTMSNPPSREEAEKAGGVRIQARDWS